MIDRIIIALDDLDLEGSIKIIDSLKDKVTTFKIHSLWDHYGAGIVDSLKKAGAKRVWVDIKLKDIPNTVALRSRVVRDAGADILTVHASGGISMMQAAVENGPQEVYAVTVLTSLAAEEVAHIHGQTVEDTVFTLAHMAKQAGVQGVVCSPQELPRLVSQKELAGLKYITPGTRSSGKDTHDQKRVTTPKRAIEQGADYLVIGRQITKAPDPAKALEELLQEIA